MRAVIDTNVLISALFWGGVPRRVVDLAASGQFQAATCPDLLAELEDVLSDSFSVPQDRLDLIIRDVLSYAEVIVPEPDIGADISVRDEGDVKVISCAMAGQVDHIVTGDKDLLDLGSTRDIQIVTVRHFLDKCLRWT